MLRISDVLLVKEMSVRYKTFVTQKSGVEKLSKVHVENDMLDIVNQKRFLSEVVRKSPFLASTRPEFVVLQFENCKISV
ncbi:hypothetical protein CEXT_213421 [Caerostris extrusa]|uniref:Uncharacterized protein n=1 Tax=Caerostris extrusa TaxID=172846 RepID=A0AAV4P8S1_CAEEX|nr:hypothetical protein CEXT_213421 [Caerostris extrusa]